MTDHEALAKSELQARCVDALRTMSGARGGTRIYVPGRIEILGKHTDYAGGRSLLCAVERGFVTVVAPRTDDRVRVIDVVREETRELALDPELEVPRGDWGAYVAASLRRLARNFPSARRGADIAFASDLPTASGMSSSSALSTSIFFAIVAANELFADRLYRDAIQSLHDLAGYLGTIENGRSFGQLAGDLGVGTFGGSEDHTAILCCRSGFVSRFSFDPVRAEGEIPFPTERVFVVAYSGIPAEKGAGAQARYNELSLGVRRIVELWNLATGRSDHSVAAAVESAPGAVDHLRGILRDSPSGDFTAERLVERFEQFVAESTEIIPRASDALARADFRAFGEEVARSQRGAEMLLRNQIPETLALVRLALAEGASAASVFGGGFGGSVWALCGADEAEGFAERWRSGYAREFREAGASAEFIITRPGPSATAS
jgi:galactokinase